MEGAPSELDWAGWGFMERMDWAAREVSRRGRGLPRWALAFHLARWLLQNALFGLVLWLAPPSSDADRPERIWRTVVRYAIFCHVLESFGWRHGPMCGGRLSPWPLGWLSNAHYRFARGTLKYTGNPLVQWLLGDTRTRLDVASHLCFLVTSAVAVLLPERVPWATMAAAACTIWVWLIDQQQATDGKGTTFVHFILAGCFPAARGGLACGQLQLIIVWMGAGICKLGPWMQFVNGPLLGGSIWLRGRPWVWRLLYRGEDDLRPTPISALVSRNAAHAEWLCPLLLFFPWHPVLVHFAVCVLIAMHLYIMANAHLDVHSWNGFFIVAGWCLFGGPGSLGFDYAGLQAAPWPLLLWFAAKASYVIFGWFRPDQVSFQAGQRHWAGNEPSAFILLKRSASDKLLAALPTFGRPPWDPIPPAVKSWFPAAPLHAGEMGVYRLLGQYWLHALSLKVLPALLQRALAGHSIGHFHVMYIFQLWDFLCGGFFFCPTHAPGFLQCVQRVAQFDEGECICVQTSGFPVAGPRFGGCRWQILDAKLGKLAEGQIDLGQALALATLPSASARVEALLGSRGKDQGDRRCGPALGA